MIIYMLLCCSFAVATAEFLLVGLLPQVAAGLSVPVPVAGQLVTVYMVVVTIGGPAGVVLTRRLSRRWLLVGTMALAVLSAAASAMAGSYPVLLAARAGSALAQALFVPVASQVAMAAAPAGRQTAAVARVFGGFSLATVAGLPLGTLIGHAYGWHAAFMAVAILAAAGLVGVLLVCPSIPAPAVAGTGRSLRALRRPGLLAGLGVTLFAMTGFVAAFTYVTPMLQMVTRLGPTGVSIGLVGYGLGTLGGNMLAGRVPTELIPRRLPVTVGALALLLLAQPVLLPVAPLAVSGLAVLGAAAFMAVPMVQTWLMRLAGAELAALVGAVNIAAAGAAGALGAPLGAAVLSTGFGSAWIGPAAAIPVLAATVLAAAAARHHRTGGRAIRAARGPGGTDDDAQPCGDRRDIPAETGHAVDDAATVPGP